MPKIKQAGDPMSFDDVLELASTYIKNDESLYYCEFNFSQSTIPLKIQQLVRCTCDNGKLTKQRVFGFAKTIDSERIIEFFGKRVILQSKIQNAQNCKINNKGAE